MMLMIHVFMRIKFGNNTFSPHTILIRRTRICCINGFGNNILKNICRTTDKNDLAECGMLLLQNKVKRKRRGRQRRIAFGNNRFRNISIHMPQVYLEHIYVFMHNKIWHTGLRNIHKCYLQNIHKCYQWIWQQY